MTQRRTNKHNLIRTAAIRARGRWRWKGNRAASSSTGRYRCFILKNTYVINNKTITKSAARKNYISWMHLASIHMNIYVYMRKLLDSKRLHLLFLRSANHNICIYEPQVLNAIRSLWLQNMKSILSGQQDT